MTSAARIAFLASTAGVGALLARTATGHPPSWAVTGPASLGWAALITTGVFFPWLKMYADVVCRGPRGSGQVALTFDDGPHPATTPKVLAALADTRHRATFFVLGHKARAYPDLIRAIHDSGHGLAIHGDVHDRLHSFRTPWRVRDEIARAQQAVEAVVGQKPWLFRPPIGHTSPGTVYGARLSRVTLIGWSARGYDGLRGRRPAAVIRRVARSLDEGAIVLLHDASEHDDFEPAGVSALPALCELLDRRSLQSVRLDQWFKPAT